ncbi:transposase [Streptomyces phaeochromogenes]
MRAAYPLLDGSFRSGVGDPQHAAYWLRAGCAWRRLPHDLPPWQTVYHYWRRWQREGAWEGMLTALRRREAGAARP